MKILKRLVCFLIFIALLAASFWKVEGLLSKKDAIEKYHSFYESDTDFDVIFMGTSHMYNSVLPQELWNDYGIASFNWGYSNCTLAMDYYLLPHILKHSNPKLVVVDLYGLFEYERFEDGNGKYRPSHVEAQHAQFDTMPLSMHKYRAIEDVFSTYEDRWNFLFDFRIFHNRWKDLTKEDFVPEYSPEKGASFLLEYEHSNYKDLEPDQVIEINSACAEYIPKIYNYCMENNIELLFTYLPYSAKIENVNCAKTLETYFQDFPGCTYLNMLPLGILNYKTDLYTDRSHLNYIGANKTTKYLGKYLQEQFQIPSHFGEESYRSWDKDYKEYESYLKECFKSNKLYENLLLLYGDKFYAKLEVSERYKEDFDADEKMIALREELSENLTIEYLEDTIVIDNKKQAVRITVYAEENDAQVFQTTFKY